ncbi:MAG: hypothetical protein OXU20_26675 [Myxococcales bacterium]|nr:hypothetical protein [Myxococcales bacterium]MDD9971384.1 hypothetical protein [Myxococcales bacterium]
MATTTEASLATNTRAVQFWSFVLPVLKCAICPACLSVFGGLFAGARMGFLGDERVHGSLIAFALVADLVILQAAIRHHGNRWPLGLCVAGGAIAVLGHVTAEALELAGFGLLILAAVQNVVLLRRHKRAGGNCCAHAAGPQGAGVAHEHG